MRKNLVIVAAALATSTAVAWVSAGPGPAPGPSSPVGRPIVLFDCPIRPLKEAKVPVRVAGVLAEILVKEGDPVRQEQSLAVVDDRLARIELEELTAKAKNDSPVLIAVAKEQEMQARVDDSEKLKRVISKEERRLNLAQLAIAKHTVDDERAKQSSLQIQQRAGEEKVRLHQVVSPIDGFVVEQVRQLGESVQALDPIFHVIQTSVVKVQGAVPLRDADRVVKGTAVEVYPNLPGRELYKLYGHTDEVLSVQMLPDGSTIASAGADGTIILWERNRGRRLKVLLAGESPIHCLAVHKQTPRRFVSGDAQGRLRVWDADSDEPIQTIDAGSAILSIALSPLDPDVCATGHEDRQIRIWKLSGGEPRVLAGHANHVTSLAITPDGKYLLSSAGDQTDRVWDFETGETIRVYRGRSLTGVSQIGLSPNGKDFLFDSYPLVQVRELLEGRPSATIEVRSASPGGIAIFAPIAGLVLTAGVDGDLRLWHQGATPEAHSRLVRSYEGHSGPVHAVDFSQDGRLVASAGADRTVRLWEVPEPETINRERKLGVISVVNPQAETGSLTVSVSAEVENSDGLLRPGAFATMILRPDRAALAAGGPPTKAASPGPSGPSLGAPAAPPSPSRAPSAPPTKSPTKTGAP